MKDEMWLVWKEPESRRRYKIGILIYDEVKNFFMFKYVNPEFNAAKECGFQYFPGFYDINKVYESSDLFANIETRLPNPSRTDYLEILNSYNLEKDSSKFEILKATRGRLITDNYEFVPAFDKTKIEFDLAGTRYCPEVKKCKNKGIMHINDKLLLKLDPNNIADSNAIKVFLKKDGREYHLGYVPRYYTKELTELLKNNVEYSAMIKSLNLDSEIYDEDISVYVKLIFN